MHTTVKTCKRMLLYVTISVVVCCNLSSSVDWVWSIEQSLLYCCALNLAAQTAIFRPHVTTACCQANCILRIATWPGVQLATLSATTYVASTVDESVLLCVLVKGPVVAQRVGRGIALLFHYRGTRRGWVVSSTPRPYFTPGKDPVPIVQEAGWASGPEIRWKVKGE